MMFRRREKIVIQCAYCQKIRKSNGEWEAMNEQEDLVSHGVCPECYEKEMKS
ncbi:MAG: hypothetical protein INQ03_07870 [Candidatus Heimdallarchaeota archaeon]|nr:hypothetical protein [Candidatus Heimdallarchaeota archaeon]